MAATRWDERFFTSTRGRIVGLLRRNSRTVDDLARELELTDNAVRAHLAALERDGLVQQRGVRRGASKPAYSYELTPEAERFFPKAYAPVLRELLAVLGERMPPAELEDVLREAGRRLARDLPPAAADLPARIEAALGLLNELGGLAELEEDGDRLVLRGYSCPLARVVPGHPEVCGLVESLLADLLGVPVHEECSSGPPARCCFVVQRQNA